MCVRNSGTDFLEKSQPCAGVQIMQIAKFRNGQTLDVFHHQIRQTVSGRAAIEKTRDVRIFKLRENLAFHYKTL